MSHFTAIKTKLKDLNCLKNALQDLNLQYKEGKLNLEGYTGTKKVIMVIKTGSTYNLGLIRTEEGNYNIVGDWWGINMKQDEFIDKLTQRYAYHKVIREVKNKGFTISKETVDQNNTIKIVVRRW